MLYFNFMKLRNRDYEVVTNLPLRAVEQALAEGFKVVDSSTWDPIDISEHDNYWIAEMCQNGYIDLVRKVTTTI